jgi:hypothetical protein
VQPSEVRIDVAREGEVASWTDDSALIASSMQVADKSFDGSCMTSFRTVIEPRDLAYRE